MTRHYSNTFIQTALIGGISALDSTMQVTSVSGAPAVPFALALDPGNAIYEEVVLVTVVSGLTLTITRGYDGTLAKSHAAGAVVIHTAIADDYRGMLLGGRGVSTSAPAAGAAPIWDGAEWVPGPAGGGGGAPSGPAGGVLSGNYPNPGFAVDMATQAELDTAIATRQPLFGNQSANTVYAGPASGGPAAPAFRSAVKADLPPSVAYEDEANIFTLGPNLFRAGADGNVALSARRNSSGATANIFEIQDEAGAALAWIAPSGNMFAPFVGAGSDAAQTVDGLFLNYIGVGDTIDTIPIPGGQSQGVNVHLTTNLPESDDTYSLAGLKFLVGSAAESAKSPSNLIGIYGEADHNAPQDLNALIGGNLYAYHYGAGAVGFHIGLYTDVQNFSGSGKANFSAGIYVEDDYSDGFFGTRYGAYIGSPLNAGADEVYSLYCAGGNSHHNGDFEFGNDAQGPVLIDRTTAAHYRLYVDSGALHVEAA